MPDHTIVRTLVQLLLTRHDCLQVREVLLDTPQATLDEFSGRYEETLAEFRAMSPTGQERFMAALATHRDTVFLIRFVAAALVAALLPPALTAGLPLPTNAQEILLHELVASFV